MIGVWSLEFEVCHPRSPTERVHHHDAFGLSRERQPPFPRRFATVGDEIIASAINCAADAAEAFVVHHGLALDARREQARFQIANEHFAFADG